MMIRQADIDTDNVRARNVTTSDDRIDNATKSMRQHRRPHGETVTGNDIVQMPRVRIINMIQSNVEIAGDVDRLLVGGDNVQRSRQLLEEGGLNGGRPRPVDDCNDASELTDGHPSA